MRHLTTKTVIDLHWSEENQMYCDANVDGNGAYVPSLYQPI
jgi:hypothetical protein